ncbi:hypothetical protein IW262DRAFT_1299663 [Armillaria fumosa]|nr:hypothetical protein IW262DRAFT_1299663 [Armillaria fumosa]
MTVRLKQQETMGKTNKNKIQLYKVDSIEEFIIYEAQEQEAILVFKDKQGPGPAEDNLILDFSHRFALSKWNRAAFMIMIPMIQGELKKDPALPAVDDDYIEETLLALPRYKASTTQLETEEEVVKHVAETGDHVHKAAASRSSKVRMLGVNGMSSEEEVVGVRGGITKTEYSVKVCIWWNEDIAKYLEEIDEASSQFTGKGSHRWHRDRETVPRMNEVVNAPRGLPRTLYDHEWLAKLDEYEQANLCISKDAFELLEKVVEMVDMPEVTVEEVD